MGGRYTVDTPIEGAAAANTSWVVLGYMWGVLLQLAWLQGDAELYVVLGYKVLQLDMWWVLLGYIVMQLHMGVVAWLHSAAATYGGCCLAIGSCSYSTYSGWCLATGSCSSIWCFSTGSCSYTLMLVSLKLP